MIALSIAIPRRAERLRRAQKAQELLRLRRLTQAIERCPALLLEAIQEVEAEAQAPTARIERAA